MGRATALETIIRRCENDRVEPARKQKLITYDHVNECIARTRPGVITRFFTNVEHSHFLVSNSAPVQYEGRRRTFRSRDERHQLNVEVRCELKCPEGNEYRVVEALAPGPSPETMLDEHLEKALDRAAEDVVSLSQDPCYDFFDYREQLESAASLRLQEITGLEVRVHVMAAGADSVSSEVEVQTDLVPVFVPTDRDLRLTVEIKTSLTRGSTSKDKALQIATRGTSSEKLSKDLREAVAAGFPKLVTTLTQYFEERGRIRDDLFELTTRLAAKLGRDVGKFDCKLHSPFSPPDFSRMEVSTKVRLADGESKLKHTLMLGIRDYTAFRGVPAKTPGEVQAWAARTLGKICEAALIDKTWLDVAARYDRQPGQTGDSYSELIESQFAAKAADLGLELRHFDTKSTSSICTRAQQFEVEHKCRVKDWPNEIVVEHKVLLELVDVDKYRRGGVRDIVAWATEEIESVTSNLLFNVSYIDVVTKFDEQEKAIRAQADALLKDKGYRIDQFVSVPRTEIAELTEGFSKPITANSPRAIVEKRWALRSLSHASCPRI